MSLGRTATNLDLLGRTVTNRSHFFPPRHLFATPAPSAVFLSMWTNQRLSLMENASTDCEQKASSGVCLISVCVTVCTQCACVCVWLGPQAGTTAQTRPPTRRPNAPFAAPPGARELALKLFLHHRQCYCHGQDLGNSSPPPHTGASILLCFSDPSGRRERPLTGAMITRQLSSRFSRLEDHGLIGHLRQRLVLSSHPLADSC